jgi:DNA-binding MarR family transcriptional regulator
VIDLLESLAFASVAMTARAIAETAGSELTFLGWRTLVIVGASEDALRLSDLAERLGVSRPSASKLVHRMARRGLLDLEPDPDDGRGLCLSLGSEGARLRAAVIDRRRRLLAESLAGAEIGARGDGDAARVLTEIATRLEKWT